MTGKKAFHLDLCHRSTHQALVEPGTRLHHPQQSARGSFADPSTEGPGTAPASHLGASVSPAGLLEVMASCCRSKTWAYASPLLSTWVEWSTHTRANLKCLQFVRMRGWVAGCAFAGSCCPSAGCWHAHSSAASSWILPSHSPGACLADYMARRGFVIHSLLFNMVWVVS